MVILFLFFATIMFEFKVSNTLLKIDRLSNPQPHTFSGVS